MYQPKVKFLSISGEHKTGRLAGFLPADEQGDMTAIVSCVEGHGVCLVTVHPSRLIFIKEHRDD